MVMKSVIFGQIFGKPDGLYLKVRGVSPESTAELPQVKSPRNERKQQEMKSIGIERK